jgi:hypothetical protein
MSAIRSAFDRELETFAPDIIFTGGLQGDLPPERRLATAALRFVSST